MEKGPTKILVAGGAGFIGSNFIRRMLKKRRDAQVLNFDKLTYSGNLDNLRDIENDKRYKFVKGDIGDAPALEEAFKKFNPNYVINFAAETHVDKSIHVGAKEFIDTNITGVFNVLELVKKTPKIKRYVQVSTDEVYGSLSIGSKKKFREDTPFAPNVPYAATKAGGDMLCRAYAHTFNVPVVVTHCSNNYGPHQYPEKVIPFFILRMLEEKKLPIYGDGKNMRDWIYVDDHCSALELCLFRGRPGEVYNIGADNEMDNLEITSLILTHFKRDKKWIEFVKDRPGHDRRYAINASKIKRELGWRPRYDFKKAFKATVEWYLANPKWIDDVRKKTGVFNPHIDLWRAHKIN
ncbi:MAG: dTDP-glucose 4,6-dehydratase [Candidatus Liptonbacteria bacterium]|nr:dTDP-glucose 4,6-dehydratase [Candidatus Liptonbacteria bacterium]